MVDSFILAVRFYEITKKREYKTLASRILNNGLSFCHRANGGAGPNTCVTKIQPFLAISMFEAPFCCTMRYCEGLKFARRFKEDLLRNGNDKNAADNADDVSSAPDDISVDEYGRVFKGDEMLVIDEEKKFPAAEKYVVNGREYIKIPALTENVDAKLKVCG